MGCAHSQRSFLFCVCMFCCLPAAGQAGTPLQNNMVELYGLLSFMYPDVFTTPGPFEAAFNLTTGQVGMCWLAAVLLQHALAGDEGSLCEVFPYQQHGCASVCSYLMATGPRAAYLLGHKQS